MPERKSPLARRIRPSVPIALGDGVELQLSFSMNALARIEERINQQRLAALAARVEDPKELVKLHESTKLRLVGNIFALWIAASSYDVLRTAFWSAVVENHREYDSDEGFAIVTSHVDTSNVDAIGEKLTEAYELFLSKDQRDIFHDAVERSKAEAQAEREKTDPRKPESAIEPPADSPGSGSGPSPDTISGSALASSAS
jgi:hypothetical protein